jgi:hypothetical protein
VQRTEIRGESRGESRGKAETIVEVSSEVRAEGKAGGESREETQECSVLTVDGVLVLCREHNILLVLMVHLHFFWFLVY